MDPSLVGEGDDGGVQASIQALCVDHRSNRQGRWHEEE